MFFGETIISIDPRANSNAKAKISFSNCIINGNIKIISDVGGAIHFYDNCVFDKETKIYIEETSEHNATGKWAGSDEHTCVYLDSEQMKGVKVSSSSSTAVLAECDLIFNGEFF